MGSLTLIAGLLLPWALGVAVLLASRDRERPLDAPGEFAWLIGVGYLAGAMLLTLWMRGLSLAGVRFGIVSIGVPLLLAAAACGYLGWRRSGERGPIAQARAALSVPAEIAGVLRFVWWALCAWLALRYALLALEITWRPLYPWDAWTAWATKARVWFEQGAIVPFVDKTGWFAENNTAWFDAEPRNPATLPLLQVWACIALGRWDDTLMNWPWWQIAIALTLVTYGGLRQLGMSALVALLAAYFVASLPLANVHVALAGYADLPLAAYYATAVLAFLRWAQTRTVSALALAALFAAACPLIKSSGAPWVVTLLPGLVVVLMPRAGTKVVAIAFGLAIFALAVLAQTNFVVAGRSLHLDFAPAWSALSDGYFIVATWNLLWYGAIGAALLTWRRVLQPPLLPLTAILAGGILLLFVVFAFPGIRAYTVDLPTLSRATLHLAPVLVIFTVLAFREFSRHWQAMHPVPVVPATPAESPAAAPVETPPAAASAS